MDNKTQFHIRILRSLEVLYTFAIIGIWAYFEISKNENLLVYAILGFALLVPSIVCLLITGNKYQRYIGIGLLLSIIIGTGMHAMLIIGKPWVIFATFYSVLPFTFVLLTWIRKKWVWIAFTTFHGLILIAASVYAITTMWTGIVDIVFCSTIIITLLIRDTRLYFNIG